MLILMEKELNSKDEEIRKLKNELNFLKAVITNKVWKEETIYVKIK